MRLILIPTLLCLAACGTVPKLDDHVTEAARQAPYPALVPLNPLLADSGETQITEQTDPALRARAAALRARARQMQQAAGQ